MSAPDIIFLNGTSSSSKTTLAQTLQQQMEAAYLHVALDAFASMFPASKLSDQELCAAAAPKLFAGFYRAIAALVECGNVVIVDTVVQRNGVELLQTLFTPFHVVYVAVRCPLEELERREIARGDRNIGLARSQFPEVHQFLQYDIEVDSHAQTAAECAAQIKQFIKR